MASLQPIRLVTVPGLVEAFVSIEDVTDSRRIESIWIGDGRRGVPFGFGVFVKQRTVRQRDSDAAEVTPRVICTGEAVLR